MSDTYVTVEATGTLTPDTEAAIARIQAAHEKLMDRLAEVVAADHEAARVEDQDYEEARAAQRHTEYQAYLCMMIDGGCLCVALGFDDWWARFHPAAVTS